MSSLFAGAHSALKDYFGGATHWVIPEYQREFSWGSEHVRQLLRDLIDGIKRLKRADGLNVRAEQGAKFLGCIIQWDRPARPGDDFEVVHGIDYLGRVNELIDGQQRTSAITLLMCELYVEIGELAKSLDTSVPEERELSEFLRRTVQHDWLLTRFSRAGTTGAVPRRRPTLIREGTDRWTHAGPPQYTSPISRYIHRTIEAILNRDSLPVANDDAVVSKILGAIRDELEAVCDHPPLVLERHYSQAELFEELYSGGSAASDIEAYLATGPANHKLINQIAAIVAISHYLLNYAAFTVITSPNQNIALDMFQSLNSTGVQLTAVQLLKPRVSQSFKQHGTSFAGDAMFSVFESVNEWLNTGRSAASRTQQFFLKFGLGLFGDEPENNSLSHQRTWLLKRFNEYTLDGSNLNSTRGFVDLMSHAVDYLKTFYFPSRDALYVATPSATGGGRRTYNMFKLTHKATGTSFQLSDGAIVAFMFIIDAKHDIAHSALLSFYVRFQQAPVASAHAAKQEFEKALLVFSSFFLLWRGLYGAQYPDDVYRQVLTRFRYTSTATTGNASQLGKALRTELIRKWRASGRRVRRADLALGLSKKLRYAAGTQTLLRLFLLFAAHQKVPQTHPSSGLSTHGLVVPDSSGPDYLYPDIWAGSDTKSIEHVAPQTLLDGHPGDWDPVLSSASDLVHSIGNLTLLSMPMNASVPEDPASKRLYYEGLVNPGAPAGVTPLASALMSKSPQLSHLVPVYIRLAHWMNEKAAGHVPCPNQWTGAFIQQRAENLSKLVLNDLLNWMRGV